MASDSSSNLVVPANNVVTPDSKGDPNAGIVVACSLVILAAVAVGYHSLARTHGRVWKYHAMYWGAAVVLTLTVGATPAAPYILSDLTTTVLGVALPIYESVRAVCTPGGSDDKAWLQYWEFGGVLFLSTTWVDHVLDDNLYWDAFLTFGFVWLYFPLTDGAVLIYDKVTLPFVAPHVRPLAAKMDNLIAMLYQTMINAVHLWILWIVFLFLPQGLKRILAVCIGTVYPLVSSIAASATEDYEDDTYWLTYWSCYGCLFLVMDILETWMGWIPGFYTLIIFTTVYLMLPMFQGADKFFRKVLVPLAGLKEMLLLRDAIAIKKAMLKDLDPERARTVRKAIAQFYNDDDDETADPAALKLELLSGWQGVKLPSLPKLSNPFASTAATETTSLV